MTPLPALGIDFTIVPGKGPKIKNPVATQQDVDAVGRMVDVQEQVPFLRPILQSLREEIAGRTTLIGFIGAPWTLAAYSVEGGHSKLCRKFKNMCLEQPQMAHAFLDKLADALCVYASHQVPAS